MSLVVQWAERISAAWQSSITGILETGRLLTAAKAALPHGEFELLVTNELPFKPTTARRLMAVWKDQRLSNGAHVHVLPPHWGTLYEMTKLSDESFEEKLRDGTIHPEMQRKDLSRERRILSREKDEARVLDLVSIAGKFKTLIIDPPWDYEQLSIAGRASPGYATMTHGELLDLPVPAWAEDDCHMYLWTTNNFMTRAVDLMAHWGFAHKTVLTWVKPRWGLGSYFRNSTEHILFGVRGSLRTRSDSIATHFEAPMGKHSEKPQISYDLIQDASFPAIGEAFQREKRDGITNLFETINE
jgi:N6-adenosine-specific RNA methylase IME4